MEIESIVDRKPQTIPVLIVDGFHTAYSKETVNFLVLPGHAFRQIGLGKKFYLKTKEDEENYLCQFLGKIHCLFERFPSILIRTAGFQDHANLYMYLLSNYPNTFDSQKFVTGVFFDILDDASQNNKKE